MSYSVSKTDDLDIINWLQRKCLPADTPYKADGVYWWAAFLDNEPVGFGGYHESAVWSQTAFLCRSGVLAAHRGCGLQKRLIIARCNHARRIGLEWAHTYTKNNPASSNSLIHCGFRLYLPTNEWGPSGAIYFRRRL